MEIEHAPMQTLDERIANLEQINKQNQELLRSIDRTMKIGHYVQIFYIVLIVGGTFGAYAIIKPFMGTAQSSLTQLQDILGN
jgi:hypothetical protein